MCVPIYAQDKDLAYAIANRAVKLEDEGNADSAIILLRQADHILPNNADINYEIGYYYFNIKNYAEALKTFNKVKGMPGGKTFQLYQIMGNCHDYLGDSAMAISTYNEGIEAFPKAGCLYLEIGNVHTLHKNYGLALDYYEKGIETEPKYPSNYYRAAQVWSWTTSPVWAMLYGEIFMNLERGTARTEDMSKWLAETYTENIKIKSKDSASVTFHKWVIKLENKKDVKNLKKGNFTMPFGSAYEQCLMLSIIGMDTMTYEHMCTMRSNFINTWYQMGNDKKYPNVLFEYQHTIKEKGHLDAYNHWVLSQSDPQAFAQWTEAHEKEWNSFLEWFKDNALVVNEQNKFLKSEEE